MVISGVAYEGGFTAGKSAEKKTLLSIICNGGKLAADAGHKITGQKAQTGKCLSGKPAVKKVCQVAAH